MILAVIAALLTGFLFGLIVGELQHKQAMEKQRARR